MSDYLESGRKACMKRFDEILSSGEKGTVIKVYLENFKYFNDTFGYDNGEQMLEDIAEYLAEVTGRTVYRFVGVEFVSVLDGLGQAKSENIVDEILSRFSHMWKIGDTECLCQVQIGMCGYPGLARTPEELNLFLDRAVSEAIVQGPGQLAIYDTQLNERFVRNKTIALALADAVREERVNIRYRPTFCQEKSRFTRAEFYMRIFVEGIGTVGYEEFIPIAEDSGQIREIEYFALRQVCSMIRRLIDEGVEFESIALPISSVLFLQEDFVDTVKNMMDEYNIPDGKLGLEIHESMLTAAYFYVNVAMQELSAMGVELILNDFGSGYSGVSSILELPVDVLKLERMFVWQLETNPRAADLIEGLIHIATRLGLKIIAEGVETDHQVDQLDAFGCGYRQGFYYAPTVESELLFKVLGVPVDEAAASIESEKEKGRKKK
ncbi:MAG: EAL domain-containing protein [Lachnospiraceae bacterium]|nr:EAL domain-containing protein [Lachnospiraceae bacterium]